MTAELLNGREIAKDYRAGLQSEVEKLKSQGIVPNLTVVIVGNDGASLSYVRSKNKAAEKIGMESSIVRLDEDTSEEDVLAEVERLNKDDKVNGILVQVPLPSQVDENKVLEALSPHLFLSCFCIMHIPRFYPCKHKFVTCHFFRIMLLLNHAVSL